MFETDRSPQWCGHERKGDKLILAQVGWGKSDYVETGIGDGSLSGAILSPKDDDPNALIYYANRLKSILKDGGLVLMDPQFYVTTIPQAKDGNLASYPYYAPSLNRTSFSPSNVGNYAKSVFDFQATVNVDRWISPTVLFNSFRDPWSQIALTLAQASLSEQQSRKKGKPLLISLVFDEIALRDRRSLDEYLDNISTLDVNGFYIIVRRNDPNYPALFEEDALVNLLYITYVLADRNGFEVVYGYSDIIGLVLLPLGARAVSSGWYSNLRQFSLSRFLPSTGGRQPRDRYTSRRLLNSIFVNPELEQINTAGRLADVISSTRYDSVMSAGPIRAIWPRKTSCLHHWKVLSDLEKLVNSGKSLGDRLDALEKLLTSSAAAYADLISLGITFEPMTGPRDLGIWQRALRRFKSEVGV